MLEYIIKQSNPKFIGFMSTLLITSVLVATKGIGDVIYQTILITVTPLYFAADVSDKYVNKEVNLETAKTDTTEKLEQLAKAKAVIK